MQSSGEEILSKIPEVTLGFWIIKILATTLGETGGDSLTRVGDRSDISEKVQRLDLLARHRGLYDSGHRDGRSF